MGESATLRDFMMIAKATRVDDAFHSRVRETVRLAAVLHPEITWRADFDLGPCEHVDIFSAPDRGAARAISDAVSEAGGVRAELAPLRNRW
jgi:hypothetical protein